MNADHLVANILLVGSHEYIIWPKAWTPEHLPCIAPSLWNLSAAGFIPSASCELGTLSGYFQVSWLNYKSGLFNSWDAPQISPCFASLHTAVPHFTNHTHRLCEVLFGTYISDLAKPCVLWELLWFWVCALDFALIVLCLLPFFCAWFVPSVFNSDSLFSLQVHPAYLPAT